VRLPPCHSLSCLCISSDGLSLTIKFFLEPYPAHSWVA
jgi:hypothetical protein